MRIPISPNVIFFALCVSYISFNSYLKRWLLTKFCFRHLNELMYERKNCISFINCNIDAPLNFNVTPIKNWWMKCDLSWHKLLYILCSCCYSSRFQFMNDDEEVLCSLRWQQLFTSFKIIEITRIPMRNKRLSDMIR